MHAEARRSFSFLVATYNHQDYILEHLESIKYLVLTYGAGIDVDLIVNDDCSRDRTRELIDQWLQLNVGLFRSTKTIYSPTNLGTCASVDNMLRHMTADRCKMTAGDDVYSFENIFELTRHGPDVAILSGRALHLFGDELTVDRISNVLATATQVVYRQDSLLHRFKHFSYNNAPNIVYATECLRNPNVRGFLLRFDVTEDWPLQVAMAREYPERRFHLIDEVLVYYRRTAGSTYIVANQRFFIDKLRIYDDLIGMEKNRLEKIRLLSRKYCFKSNHKVVNKIFNLDFYFFALACLMRAGKIYSRQRGLSLDIERHRKHLAAVQQNAVAARRLFTPRP